MLNRYRLLGQTGLRVSPLCLGTRSPLAGGVLTGKYSREDLQSADRSGRKGTINAIGQLTEQSLAIADVVKQIATEIDRTPGQVALNWILQQPSQPIPIIGASKIAHLTDNLGALDFSLTTEQVDRLSQISAFSKPFPHNFIELDMYRRVLDGDTQIEAGFSVYQKRSALFLNKVGV